MRIAQKQEVLDCIDSLHKANEEIREALRRNDIILAQNMLSQCQEFAVSLGENIEKLEGEGHATVSCLEEYCEVLYRVYNELGSGTVNSDKIHKMLRRQLFRVESSAGHEIRARREVVFLPYKSSMWDSLESVWQAAEADEDTDAWVIPIPYYDKNSDGSFGEMHYEAGQYPEYVPVVWYEDYDFEKRRPDMIFIHNPYDECNYVTSVLPFFYSANLKKFTERLVYIPYFVLGEIEPEDKRALEELKKFCLVPGVFYADKVIVQSEKMRQAYINVLTEFMAGQIGYERIYWEKKILGLGSPKIDKVLGTGKENLNIPEEWMKMILKPDGSRKKIIFYNTSVTTLLHHNEQYLMKMRDVFRVFYENRDHVALLWRPHPLMEATIASLRPELWEAYREIAAQYKKEGWGIYDDTADMNRAVALSDGYYGDGSSVVQLYQETGKPILMQNVYSLPENNYSLAMDNIVEYQGEWWFLALKDNGLYRMNKDTFEATLVVRIPWKEYMGIQQYRRVCLYQNKIYIIPCAPVEIAVYNLENQNLYYIDYERETVNRGMVFCESIMDGNRLYLIPGAYENILCMNMDTEEITYIRLDEALREKGKRHLYAWGSVFFDNGTVYMTMQSKNLILECELHSGKVIMYPSDQLAYGGFGICGDENDVWIISGEAGRMIHWDRKKKTADQIKLLPDKCERNKYSFFKVISCGKYFYLLPRLADGCLVIDKTTKEISKLELEEKSWEPGNFYDKFFRYAHVWENHGEIYMIHTRRGDIYCIDGADGKKVQLVKHISIAEKNSKPYGNMERENRFENVQNYISMLSCREVKGMKSEEQKVGLKIWMSVEK